MSPDTPPPFRVLFVSGPDGGTRRYRCFHPIEQLRKQGVPVGFREWSDEAILLDALEYDIFVLHRVFHSDLVAQFLDAVHTRDKLALFETDDLVFDPAQLVYDGYYAGLPADEAPAYEAAVHSQARTLDRCDYALTTTEFLAEQLERRGKRAFVHRNALSKSLIQISQKAYERRLRRESGAAGDAPLASRDRQVTIAYFSGSPSHDRDFATIAPALAEVLDRYAQARLHICGHLTLGDELSSFDERITRTPYMAWHELPYAIARADINLAPLEPDNPFCESKSELKYFEAAAARVPTVASSTRAFEYAIRHGQNGLLARDSQEWVDCIDLLVRDAALRAAIGEAAHRHALREYTPEVRGRQLEALLSGLLSGQQPIAGPGRTIPRLDPCPEPGVPDELRPVHEQRRRPGPRLGAWARHAAKKASGQVYRTDTTAGTCQLVDELTAGHSLGQTFRAAAPDLCGVDVFFATYGRENTSSLVFRLRDRLESGDDLAVVSVGAHEIRDHAFHTFWFDSIPDSENQMFYFSIESPNGVRGDAVGLWSHVADTASEGTFFCDGSPGAGRILHSARYSRPEDRHTAATVSTEDRQQGRPRVYFISGCQIGTTHEYRVVHKQEQLALHGIESKAEYGLRYDEPTLKRILEYDILYLYRVALTPHFEELIRRARARNIPVVFDTDDLIFEPDLAAQVDSLGTMSDEQVSQYFEGVWRYRHALIASDYVVASTEFLAELARKHGRRTFVHRNALSAAFIRIAQPLYVARNTRPSGSDRLVIGYSSGTSTHDRDFQEAAAALAQILERHEDVELHILGPLKVPGELGRFGDRVRNLDLVHWTDVPLILNTFDINLGPLEPDNPFCRAKSEVKYIEAAALGIPTIASRIDAFDDAIRDGANGYLAGSEAEWTEKLEALVSDPELRRRIGDAARADVLARYSPQVRGDELVETVQQILDLHGERLLPASVTGPAAPDTPLVLNWVFTEWSPGSGGHTNILRSMNLLASFGHQINVYVVPFRWLGNKSDPEIREYMHRDFADLDGFVFKWDGSPMVEADATIVTYWETAYLIEGASNLSKVFYFVQDWEPFFYPMGTQYLRAEQTYKMGLSCITLGSWLTHRLRTWYNADADYFDLAVDHTIYYPRPVPKPAHPRVNFYARPSTPRRLFAIGIEALERVHEECPEAEIVLYGATDAEIDVHYLTFPYTNRGVLTEDELAELFSSSDVGLVLSTTNCSLVPREMMACKCAIVDLDRETVEGVLEHEVNALLAEPTPQGIADAVVRLLRDEALRRRLIKTAYRQAKGCSWEKSTRTVEGILVDKLAGSSRVLDRPRPQLLPNLPCAGDMPQIQRDRLDSIHDARRGPGSRWRSRAKERAKRRLEVDQGKSLQYAPVQITGELRGRRTVGQEFVALRNHLYRIDVLVATYGRRNTRDVILHLRESPSAEKDLATARVNASLFDDNCYARFVFEPQPASRGRTYYFFLESPESAPGDAITLWAYSWVDLPEPTMYRKNRAVTSRLVFGSFYAHSQGGHVGERPLLSGWRQQPTSWDRLRRASELLSSGDVRGLWNEARSYVSWRSKTRQ